MSACAGSGRTVRPIRAPNVHHGQAAPKNRVFKTGGRDRRDLADNAAADTPARHSAACKLLRTPACQTLTICRLTSLPGAKRTGRGVARRLADCDGNFTEAGYRIFQFLIAADRSPDRNKVFAARFNRPRKVEFQLAR